MILFIVVIILFAAVGIFAFRLLNYYNNNIKEYDAPPQPTPRHNPRARK